MTKRIERTVRSDARALNREIFYGTLEHYGKYSFNDYIRQVHLKLRNSVLDAMVLGYAVSRKRLQRELKLSLGRQINRLLRPDEYNVLRMQFEYEADRWSRTVRIDLTEAMLKWAKFAQMNDLSATQAARSLQTFFRARGYSKTTARNIRTVFHTAYRTGLEGAKYVETAHNPEVWGYRWQTAGDERVRESHALLQGTTLPRTDPFWTTTWPPIDYNCRCYVEVLVEEEDIVQPPKHVPVAPGFGRNPFKEFHSL